MSKREKRDNAYLNNATYIQYYNQLTELAVSVFEWIDLPSTIDERFLEMTLFNQGQAIFFKDEILEWFLALECTTGGSFAFYNQPTTRRAIANNGYGYDLGMDNSVIIYNNYLRTNSVEVTRLYARKLYEIDRTIDVNVSSQKTPLVIRCSESQRLTLLNVYKEYMGNEPFIFGDKELDIESIKVLPTNSPYVADKLQILKRQVWNEALTQLGIENANTEKKERLISDEVNSNLGAVEAQRFTKLNARKQACKKINEMFDLNIDVRFRSSLISKSEEYEESEGLENE